MNVIIKIMANTSSKNNIPVTLDVDEMFLNVFASKKELMSKLMQLKNCKSRAEVDKISISSTELEEFLAP